MKKENSYKNLLIISCSQRKKKVEGKVRAWDLYDGVIFRVLKKIERESRLPKNLDILILSAKYGVIKPSDLIEYYDHRLNSTHPSFITHHSSLITGLKEHIRDDAIANVFICLGKDYLKAIKGFEVLFPVNTVILYASGGIGLKMSCLKRWILNLKVL